MAFSRLPLKRGALYGLVAYALSYALVHLVYAGSVRRKLGQTTVETVRGTTTVAALTSEVAVPTWKGTGWFFYGANGVPIQVPGQTRFVSANVLFGTDWFGYAFTAVLILLFVAGGYVTYVRTNARVGQWKYAGVGMALGYALPMIVGAILISVPVRAASAGPNLLLSLVAGVAIPTIAGAIGARIAA